MHVSSPASSTRAPVRASVPRRSRRGGGFTLIEIMAVVVIMGLLMTVLAVGITGQVEGARLRTASLQISRIEQALAMYQLDNARFPTNDQGLQALVRKPSSPPEPRNYTPGGYLKSDALRDPWDNPYQYQVPGEHNPHAFDLWSLGPDGQEGGDDVTNWDASENGG